MTTTRARAIGLAATGALLITQACLGDGAASAQTSAASGSALPPLPAIIGVGVVLLALAGGFIYKLRADAQAERIAFEQRAAQEQDKLRRDADERARRLEAQIRAKEQEMKTAKTEDERARLRAELERA